MKVTVSGCGLGQIVCDNGKCVCVCACVCVCVVNTGSTYLCKLG